MARLTNLIKEILSTQPKKKDCNCGCNTYDNVGNEGVLLNESVAPKQILSENLQYHVHNKLPLTENTFRYGSNSFINLWAEARALYLREIIHVNDDDKEILTETDLGNYGIYEGKKIPLDLPMLNENVSIETLKDEFEKEFNVRTSLIGNQKLIILDKGVLYKFDEMVEFIESNGFKVNTDLSSIEYEIDDDRARYPFIIFSKNSINEAKNKKKKDPPIGKPKRGGSKAYYVYVRDPRTKKVKKISFGSGGLKAKINNPKARKAFAARHKCSTKTDKTKAGYWSCRLPRYAKLLGLKSSFSGFW